jgi:hypothetical protein
LISRRPVERGGNGGGGGRRDFNLRNYFRYRRSRRRLGDGMFRRRNDDCLLHGRKDFENLRRDYGRTRFGLRTCRLRRTQRRKRAWRRSGKKSLFDPFHQRKRRRRRRGD